MQPSDILKRIRQVDGKGSGLDTDLVQGRQPRTLGLAILQAETVGDLPPGIGGSGTYYQQAFPQVTPSALWVINHTFDHVPTVKIIDSGGTEVLGQITHTSPTQVQIAFGAGFAGTAYLS